MATATGIGSSVVFEDYAPVAFTFGVPVGNFILKEDSFFILQEGGDKILLE